GLTQHYLGLLSLAERDLDAAQAHLEQSLAMFRLAGSDAWLGSLLESFADLAAARSELERAVCLAAAAAALQDTTIAPLPRMPGVPASLDLAAWRKRLGAGVFADARRRGHALSLYGALEV